ncbi:uncharacterized protein LOC110944986 [Helianthus annuus]|uniref:uncharacterized protein LOC110944986 n=1 Tax=Helianthus annuus TaxID=4232 RepID=UPI000B8F568C|nr:uncharacterized protein LOC110944986 [Helianthus annuus]
MRPLIRNHIWSELGNGGNTSVWFDYWSELGPLGDFISPRNISDADFRLDNRVADVYADGSWLWPTAWRDSFPVLNQIDHVQLDPLKVDRLLWKDGSDINEFSSSGVWHSLRHREPEVDWGSIVWFGQCIPRHAFMMWLIMKGKLLTQDKILQWDLSRRKNMNMMCCLLCYQNVDSHPHLFFECKYSTQVWRKVRDRVGMSSIAPRWTDIVQWLCNRDHQRRVDTYVAKLLVAAAAYSIWQERNARLFKNQLRSPETVSDVIMNTVRYKLMGAKLKNTVRVRNLLREWEIRTKDRDDDGG